MALARNGATIASLRVRIKLLAQDMPRNARAFRSLAHYLDNDAFGALSVELRIINLLPRPEVERTGGHRDYHLMMHQQALQVRIAVGLAGAVVAVIVAIGRQIFQPF